MAQLSTLIRTWTKQETAEKFRTMQELAEVNTILKASAERRLTDRLIEALAEHPAIIVVDLVIPEALKG